MSELSLHQRERIERAIQSRRRKRSRQPEPTASQKANAIIAWFGLGVALLILAALFLVSAEWQPGRQMELARGEDIGSSPVARLLRRFRVPRFSS